MKNLTELEKANRQIECLTFDNALLKKDKELLNNKLHKAEMSLAQWERVKK